MKRNPRGYFLSLVLLLFFGICHNQIATAQVVADPGVPGPREVTRAEYNFGATALIPAEFPVPIELQASVHYPTDLSGGPFPLIIFLHGRHVTCYDRTNNDVYLKWPCLPRQILEDIPSYEGYDYIAEVLASHGYIVASVGANGINARDNQVFDLGMQARAILIQRHLDLWREFTTTGGAPFGDTFVGKVDLNNVGTMGHSRGGEGVVRHYVYNAEQGSPYGIKAVMALAPVDFNRFVINNVPLGVILPYCDGDVSDLQGVHFFDDARYNVPGDTAPKHTILVKGANHNFYNTVWTPSIFEPGSADDWLEFVPGGPTDSFCGSVPGNQRLTAAQQRGTGLAYIAGFFRAYLGNEAEFFPMLTGAAPPPPSAQTNRIFVSYHAPDLPNLRRDVNRLLDFTNLTINTLGGIVAQSGFTPYDLCGGEAPQPPLCLPLQPNSRQPHTTPSARAPGRRGLSQLRGGWTSTSAFYRNDLPEGSRDASGFQALQFRAAVNFSDARNPPDVDQDLSVVLIDGAGNTASGRISDFSQALYYPPGRIGPVPKVVLNMVRLPLSAFTGVDLTDVRSIQFNLDQLGSGALLNSDIAFANGVESVTVAPAAFTSAGATSPANNTEFASSRRIAYRQRAPYGFTNKRLTAADFWKQPAEQKAQAGRVLP